MSIPEQQQPNRYIKLPPVPRTCTDCGGPIEDSAPQCPSCAAIVPYYTLSCGNVFADLGLPDAEELLATSDRAIAASRVQLNALRVGAEVVPQVVPPPAWAVPGTRQGEILPEALPPWYDRDPPGMPDPVDDFIEQEGAVEGQIGVALGTVCPRCAVRLPLASDQLHVCGVPREDAPVGAAGVDER